MPDGKPSDILSWWKLRDHSLPADPKKGRPEGLPRLARMARQYHKMSRRPPPVPSGSSQSTKASRAHHDLRASMEDNTLEHELLALANTD